MKKAENILVTFLLLLVLAGVTKAQSFVHPGILHSKEDFERIKKAVANKSEPIFAGYKVFTQNPASQYSYKMQGPLETVGRNPTVGQGVYDSDANAAHQNAVMWAISGDKSYADKAIEIVNAWSATLKSVTGRDAVLMAGLGPFKMVNAAEILRHTNAGWNESDARQAEKHFKEVIYPVLRDFAPFANGNWDAAAIKTVMAIAVFCNDRQMFERALCYYVTGHGNGSLTHYVINENGQIQESGRDQPHSQLGIGMLAESCEIAWKQGLDLYSLNDNLLLKGFEYTAKYNLNNDNMPFQEWLDRTGKYHHTKISDKGRGELRALFEQVYNHYVIRQGLGAPYTQQAAEKLRPEGPGRPGADHPGYGTFYFTRSKSTENITFVPCAPSALIAGSGQNGISLTWVSSIGATAYTIKRAEKKGGPYQSIGKNVKQRNFIDKNVKPGSLYYYTVTATNAKGESGNAYEAAITAGLPLSWKQQTIGSISSKGHTVFNGKTFVMEGVGIGIDSTSDETHFTYQLLQGDGEITVRFVPQPSSQFSRMGLMIRGGLRNNSQHVSLFIYPGKTGQIEAPNWHVRLVTRESGGRQSQVQYTGPGLTEPAVTFGRLTGAFWLRLNRKGNSFFGFTSYDGKKWTEAGEISLSLSKNALIGFSASSGMPNSTTIFFDNVAVSKNKK